MTAIWVRLDALFPTDGVQRVILDGLDPTGSVPGHLVSWQRTVHGAWLAVVHYPIPYADGRARWFHVRDQLVPATVVRPREERG